MVIILTYVQVEIAPQLNSKLKFFKLNHLVGTIQLPHHFSMAIANQQVVPVAPVFPVVSVVPVPRIHILCSRCLGIHRYYLDDNYDLGSLPKECTNCIVHI